MEDQRQDALLYVLEGIERQLRRLADIAERSATFECRDRDTHDGRFGDERHRGDGRGPDDGCGHNRRECGSDHRYEHNHHRYEHDHHHAHHHHHSDHDRFGDPRGPDHRGHDRGPDGRRYRR